MFEVRTDVPLPDIQFRRRGEGQIYPFDQMDVGHSFFVPPDKFPADTEAEVVRKRIMNAANEWGKKKTPRRRFLVVVQEDNSVGCWRVE